MATLTVCRCIWERYIRQETKSICAHGERGGESFEEGSGWM